MRDVVEIVKEKLLRKKEVAALLACSERTVDRLVAVGRLARVKSLFQNYKGSIGESQSQSQVGVESRKESEWRRGVIDSSIGFAWIHPN
jgi:hypothetical protein